MNVKLLIRLLTASLLLTVQNANAVVINTLGGVEYEWLELTATAGMSRNEVEAELSDSNSQLFGYEYATRALVEDLFLSYSPWNGQNGYHTDNAVVSGATNYLNDFGILFDGTGNGTPTGFGTVDGTSIFVDSEDFSQALYGLTGECGSLATCWSEVRVSSDINDTVIATKINGGAGWDESATPFVRNYDNKTSSQASLLVKRTDGLSIVPIPAAVWLFGSGLLGLIGIARRKKA